MQKYKILLCIIMVIGSAFGAQPDAGEEGNTLGYCDKKARKKLYMDFSLGDDKIGYIQRPRQSVTLKANARFVDLLKQKGKMSFEYIATNTQEFFLKQYAWERVFDILHSKKNIGVDLAEQCLVWDAPVVAQPEELIEVVIQRIFIDNPKTIRRDLMLSLYAAGYRDYCPKAIASKETVLVSLGFIKKIQCCVGSKGTLFSRMCNNWRQIMSATNKQALQIYANATFEDAAKLYQMLYMKKHGIFAILQRDIDRNDGKVFGFAQHRQNKILQYILERERKPIAMLDLVRDVERVYTLPNGILYEVASLVFLGKVRGSYDAQQNICILERCDHLPMRAAPDDRDDAVVFFQNLREYASTEGALLGTYMQGYTRYSPEKLVACRKAFDLIGLGVAEDRRILWSELFEFLQKHEKIPPIWQWTEEWVGYGRNILCSYSHITLGALFDMHNRGVLKLIQSMQSPDLQQVPAERRMFSDLKEFLQYTLQNRPEPYCLDEFVSVLQKTSISQGWTWHGMLIILRKFIRHLHYNEVADVMTWLETPRPMQEYDESEETEVACMLRNRHPKVGVDGLAFLLAYMGLSTTPEKARTIFAALDIAGLVRAPSHRGPFIKRCSVFFEKAKETRGTLEATQQVFAEKSLGERGLNAITMALKFSNNERLTQIAKQNPPWVRVKGCSRRKRTKVDSSVLPDDSQEVYCDGYDLEQDAKDDGEVLRENDAVEADKTYMNGIAALAEAAQFLGEFQCFTEDPGYLKAKNQSAGSDHGRGILKKGKRKRRRGCQ